MATIEIYTKQTCGFCHRAKRMLDMKKIEYREIPVDHGGPPKEEMVQRARGRTTVAIAHRLSTVRDAEQIAVLDRGRLVELGDHDELMAMGGRYAAMVEVQGGDLTPA